MRIFLWTLVLSHILATQLFAHSGKPKYHVIIDTDGALDDMRSITMFLSCNDIRVLAITCSQGTLLPDTICDKVESLLYTFHHEGIPIGVGDETKQELPVWSPFAQGITWGGIPKNETQSSRESSNVVLERTTENYRNKITLIALGSLKTYADWVKSDTTILEKIDKIIWYNNPEIEDGFNYKASPESFNYIKQTGIDLVIVGNNSDKFTIDKTYLDLLKETNSPYAQQIVKVHSQAEIKKRIEQGHLKFWDDIIPLYLTVPLLFEVETRNNIKFVKLNQSIPESFINEVCSTLLQSATTTNNRVFNTFPVDTTLYKPEYAKILHQTIEAYGAIEWKAICMTNEIHGHTGIYSIIGAKMGVRAMEYFNVGINNMDVTTYAGNKPPLSCLNDGIQISTGCTIGQGLITIADSISVIPTVVFEFNRQKVHISVKQEVTKQIQEDIKYGVKTYGLLSEQYWIYIEELAIKYWSTYNRYDIFDFEIL